MAEEQRFQAPRLCANNCGFFGSPATLNLCSKCYYDLRLKEQQSPSAKHALNPTVTAASTATTSSSSAAASLATASSAAVTVVEQPVQQPHQRPSRCMACWRRVGLTGFKCRCGSVFCGTHRYPEQHECGFDFKGTGKEEIAKSNPVVKAEKLEKI